MRTDCGVLSAMKHLDRALIILETVCPGCTAEYEDAIELWITYGGD